MYTYMFERKSNRLQNFDYSSQNYYFVTVCTQNRSEYFGEILNYDIILSDVGKIVEKFWREIPSHYTHVEIDEFVVMPNHLHGIIVIKTTDEADMAAGGHRYTNLSTIVGSFKNITSKLIHKSGCLEFAWQKSFYDHVIRKDESLDEIRSYIRNNPLKWELDRNNSENLWM